MRRSGITLIEVLIAMFVMALGITSLMALFPVGVMQMAKAVKDERTAQMAMNGEGLARIFWRDAWLSPNGGLRTEYAASDVECVLYKEPALAALDSISATTVFPTAAPTNLGLDATKSASPSYAVLMDPIGEGTYAGSGTANLPKWVGAIQGLVARRTLAQVTAIPNAAQKTAARIRFCCMLDDLDFDRSGAIASPIARDSRYSIAWLYQRPKNSVRHEVNVNVLVFHSRQFQDTAAQAEFEILPTSGTSHSLTPGATLLTCSATSGTTRLPLKVGNWIMMAGTPDLFAGTQPFVDFYRVTGIAEPTTGQLNLEVYPPFKSRNGTVAYSAKGVAFDGLAEVFDRGTLTPFTTPAP